MTSSRTMTSHLRPRDLLRQCHAMAQSDTLTVRRIRRLAHNNVDLLERTHDLLAKEWNSEIRNDDNRYGHHTNQKSMYRTLGILKALGMAVAGARDLAYERGRKPARPFVTPDRGLCAKERRRKPPRCN